MARPELWVVRHGETEWSRSGRHTSTTDVELTEAGREQARGLADALRGNDFGLVLSSPMKRATETAELAGFFAFETTTELCEWNYGDYEGVTTDDIRRTTPDWTLFTHDCPHGETASAVGQRVDAVIARVRSQSEPALLFAHGHVLRVLAARWASLPPEAGAHFKLGTAELGVLGWDRDAPAIERWGVRPQ